MNMGYPNAKHWSISKVLNQNIPFRNSALYQMYYFFSQSLILRYLKMSNAFILSFFSAYNIKLSHIYTCKVISFGYSYILHR